MDCVVKRSRDATTSTRNCWKNVQYIVAHRAYLPMCNIISVFLQIQIVCEECEKLYCFIYFDSLFLIPVFNICDDMWWAYNGIANILWKHFMHLQMNHSQSFVNPHRGLKKYRNTVESLWNAPKLENKRLWNEHCHMIGYYLCKYMWKKSEERRLTFVWLFIAWHCPF